MKPVRDGASSTEAGDAQDPEGNEGAALPGQEPSYAPDPADALSDLTQLYLHDIGAKPLLGADEERAVARTAVAGDFTGRQTMIERASEGEPGPDARRAAQPPGR